MKEICSYVILSKKKTLRTHEPCVPTINTNNYY